MVASVVRDSCNQPSREGRHASGPRRPAGPAPAGPATAARVIACTRAVRALTTRTTFSVTAVSPSSPRAAPRWGRFVLAHWLRGQQADVVGNVIPRQRESRLQGPRAGRVVGGATGLAALLGAASSVDDVDDPPPYSVRLCMRCGARDASRGCWLEAFLPVRFQVGCLFCSEPG